MPLPAIQSVNPTSAPAIPAMEFNNSFCTALSFSARSPDTNWSVQFVTRNYNAENAVLAPDTPNNNRITRIPNMASYAAEYPVAAQGLATVLVLVGLIQTEQKAQEDLRNANNLDDDDSTKSAKVAAATSALAAARTALGA